MKTSRLILRAVEWLVRLGIGGTFVYAGTTKVLGAAQLIRDIWHYRLVSDSWAYWIAAYLPFLEIVAGLALITGLQRRGARLILGAMLVGFSVALASAWMRGLDVACGCFGSAATATGFADYAWLIGRDLLMLGALVLGAWAERRNRIAPAAASEAA